MLSRVVLLSRVDKKTTAGKVCGKGNPVQPHNMNALRNYSTASNRMEAYLASAGVSTGSIAILFLLYRIWLSVKGHRLVSDCCGRFYEVGVDVRDMPPTPVKQETESHLPPSSVPEALSSESLSVSVPKEPVRPLDLKKASSVRRHLPQPVVEDKTAPE